MTGSEWFMGAGVLLCVLNVILAVVLIRRIRGQEAKFVQSQMDPTKLDGYLTVTGYDEDTAFPDFRLTISRDPNEIAEKEVARFRLGTPPPQAA